MNVKSFIDWIHVLLGQPREFSRALMLELTNQVHKDLLVKSGMLNLTEVDDLADTSDSTFEFDTMATLVKTGVVLLHTANTDYDDWLSNIGIQRMNQYFIEDGLYTGDLNSTSFL